MKRIVLISGLLLFACSFGAAQDIGAAVVKDMDGNSVRTTSFDNDGSPMIISFWATWCAPCKKELNNISDVYEDWVDETGVKLIAIAIDDTKTKAKVLPYVNQQMWDYEVYLDENSDFKRAMGVNNVPHTFLIDGDGNIVYEHNNYAEGDEDELYEHVLELVE